VERRAIRRTLRAVGKVAVDERRTVRVHTKYAGFIEELYADFVGRPVKEGEPLFTIYSPELVAAQQEYLVALRARQELRGAPHREVIAGTETLVEAARERLRLWDVTEEEIARLEREGKPRRTLTVYAPASGMITGRAAFPRGRTVTPEMELFTITDFSDVWLIAELYEFEAAQVRMGQAATVRLSYQPESPYRARVSYIFPTVDPKTRTVRVRLDLPNPALELKPEMFADVEFAVDYGTHVVVPEEAVLDSGTQKTVFVVHEGGYFEPRAIRTAGRLAGLPDDSKQGEPVIVLAGLKPGERVVTSANFLIDSESRLRSATRAMQHQH
jgi:RND family efflux transporter MFP subunit